MSLNQSSTQTGTQTGAQTINDLFRHAVAREKPGFLNFKRDGMWQVMSASELAEQVRVATMGLYALGVRNGDRVAILSENRVEWTVADFAVLNGGAVDVPIYATQAPKQVAPAFQRRHWAGSGRCWPTINRKC